MNVLKKWGLGRTFGVEAKADRAAPKLLAVTNHSRTAWDDVYPKFKCTGGAKAFVP